MSLVAEPMQHTAPEFRAAGASPVWTTIPGVFQLIMVAHVDGMPVALIEKIAEGSFQLTTSTGDYLGVFESSELAQTAYSLAS